MVILGGFRFCYTYLKTFGTKFNSITNLTAFQVILAQPANCCSYYMNIVSNTIQASILCICMLICSNKNCFLTKCCVGGGSIQKCVLTIQIESSIYKLVR